MSTPSGLRFIAHSSVIVHDDDGDLLMDPWFFGAVFNGCTALLAPPDLESLDVSGVRHVWVSHEHPDHLHIPTLRWVRDAVTGSLTAHVRRSPNPVVRDTLAGMGYDVVELRPGREQRLGERLAITMYPAADDSALVIRHGDLVTVNQNDAELDDVTLERIRARAGDVDVWLFQFSYGGWYANADAPDAIEAVRQSFRDRMLHYHRVLQPTVFVPFASFVRYVKPACAFLNDHAVTPSELVAEQPELPIQLPWGGEEIQLSPWDDRTTRNEVRWRQLFESPVELVVPEEVTEERLRSAGDALVARSPWGTGPPETHVEITGTGRVAVFDFRHACFDIIDRADPAKLVVGLPADELLYFCESPYGADVVYGGCLHMYAPSGWEWLRSHKAGLQPGEPATVRRRIGQRLAVLEAGIAGGRVREARQHLRRRLTRR